MIQLTLLLCALAPQIHVDGGGLDLKRSEVGGVGAAIGDAVIGLSDLDGDGVEDYASAAGQGSGVQLKVHSGASGQLIWGKEFRSQRHVRSLASLGDLDGDGHSELLACVAKDHWYDVTFKIFSGASGDRIANEGPPTADNYSLGFGHSSLGAPDLNGDGVADFLIGARDALNGVTGYRAGKVYVYSGADFQLLDTWRGTAGIQQFGEGLACISDVNGDGVDEIVVGSPSGTSQGKIQIFSGSSGAVLAEYFGTSSIDLFGKCVVNAGDQDGDGFDEILVGAPVYSTPSMEDAGMVRMLHGQTGAVLFEFVGEYERARLGHSAANVGDQDGDQRDDFVVIADGYARNFSKVPTRVHVLGGTSGASIQAWDLRVQLDLAAAQVIPLPDSSGAIEKNDFLVTSRYMGLHGGTHVYSHKPFMQASNAELSVSAGASVSLEMDFPGAPAGWQEYRVLFSQSGTVGFEYGVPIPLTFDSMVSKSFQGSYYWLRPFGLSGRLDGEGNAQAYVRSAPGAWSHLIGRDFFASAVALDAAGIPTHASEAIQFTVIP